MYRERQLITVSDLDGWNEVVAIVEESNKLCATKGWTQGTLYTRTIGRFNELCLEREFPDLATYERETKAWETEPHLESLFRRMDAIKVEDPGYSEMWQEAVPVQLDD